MDTIVIVSIIFLLIIIVIFCYFLSKTKGSADSHGLSDSLRMRISDLEKEVSQKDDELRQKNSDITTLVSERDVLKSQNEAHIGTIERQKEEYENRIKELSDAHSNRISEITTVYERMLAQVRESTQKQINQLKENNEAQLKKLQELNSRQVEDQLALIKEQMKTTSEQVLKQRQNELDEHNIEHVSKIVNPLMESLKGMKEAFDISKEKQKEALTRLDETIRLNTQKSQTLGETADRLARALSGEVKAQGNFGELKLKQLLENMDLHEGEQYDTQETLRDKFGKKVTGDDGKGLIPDYILHFPGNRHVVIDAKMSLTAYQRYMNADDNDPQRSVYLAEHISSVRNNVTRLAKKSYSRFLPEGYNRLDFAFMYVPVEAALNLALLNDNTLWKEAYDQGVIILGPQTMYMNLRVLEMMWTQIRQLENQQTMIDCANLIIDRVQDFATRFKDIDTSMREVVKRMDKFNITTSPSGRSIITAAQNLVKAGGQENRTKISLSKSATLFTDTSHVITDSQPAEDQLNADPK